MMPNPMIATFTAMLAAFFFKFLSNGLPDFV
jgi:hypothetical protein